jgi:hypothetical protein
VRLHRIPQRERARLRAQFSTYRHAGWRAGALLAGAASGVAAPVDLAAIGMVHINNASLDAMAPFGGYKQSGNGREWGAHGMDEFLEVKSVYGYDMAS